MIFFHFSLPFLNFVVNYAFIMALPNLFNPSNDMALAANVREYLPPKRIQQMEADLADVARVWEGTRFAGPWGWSLATKRRYECMGISSDEQPSDDWIATVRGLSSRQFACEYIKTLLAEIEDDILLGNEMAFIDGSSFIDTSVFRNHPFPLIFKSPWSSSGRGVFVSSSFDDHTKSCLQGFINTQGGFLIDRFHANKTLDFAMEFFINPDHSVEFLGYSVFHAATTGAYGYNLVESQEELMQRIGVDHSLLQRLIDHHKTHLSRIAYHGAVGIDMLKCTNGNIHPCIEINLRMNMGILSILLHQRYGSRCSLPLTPPRPHGFQALIDDGKLMIIYRK